MFRPVSFKIPLLFTFDFVGMHAIHSFFCRTFLAVWILEENGKMQIIDVKTVSPWKISVVPAKRFNLLLEIPL